MVKAIAFIMIRSIIIILIPVVVGSLLACGGDTTTSQDHVKGEASIGILGGTIEIDDPSDPLCGVKIVIREGTLLDQAIIRLVEFESEIMLPPGIVQMGPAVMVECDDCVPLNTPMMLYLPVNGSGAIETSYLAAFQYNEDETTTSSIQSWYDFKESEIILLIDEFNTYLPVASNLLNGDEFHTSFDISNDSMAFQNDSFEACPEFSLGVCSAIAYFSEWYFENIGHGLNAAFDESTAQQISCTLFDEVIQTIWDDVSLQYSLPEVLDYTAVHMELLRSLQNGTPKTLFISKPREPGYYSHAILVYRWHPTDAVGNGYFTCYDVNDNTKSVKLFSNAIEVDIGPLARVINLTLEYDSDYIWFGVWDKPTDAISSIFDQFEPNAP